MSTTKSDPFGAPSGANKSSIQVHFLLSQAEDRAPLESDPSADLEAGMRVGSHTSRLSLAS